VPQPASRDGSLHSSLVSMLLRRAEVQLRYDTAFLYLNTNGAIAQRWGHGPDFTAWAEGPGQITLTAQPINPDRTAVLGLRVSGVTWHLPRTKEEFLELGTEFLSDCLEYFKPTVVRQLWMRQQWILPTLEPDALNAKLLKTFPNIDGIVPPDYDHPRSGLSFNGERQIGQEVAHISNLLGIYAPQLAQSYFGAVFDSDDRHALGAFAEVTLEKQGGIENALDRLPDLIRTAGREIDEVIRHSLGLFG